MNDRPIVPSDLDVANALAILAARRQRDLADAILALDLTATLLNVIREDALAVQVLDIKSTLKTRIAQETRNAMDLERRSQTHPQGPNAGQTETMGLSRELGLEANRGRGLSDPASERGNGEGTRQHKDRS